MRNTIPRKLLLASSKILKLSAGLLDYKVPVNLHNTKYKFSGSRWSLVWSALSTQLKCDERTDGKKDRIYCALEYCHMVKSDNNIDGEHLTSHHISCTVR